MKPWPNFFVIGAGKSGTTSLYYYLKQHPQIFMSPVKEPKFFTAAVRPLEFNGPGDQRVVTDTVTSEDAYLGVVQRRWRRTGKGRGIHHLPEHRWHRGTHGQARSEARLVAVLRHPADRAYSAFMHLRRDGHETLEYFEDALDAEEERVKQGYYYHWRLRGRGYYGHWLKAYYEHFPREQIKVFLYEDLLASAEDVMAEIFRFLEVDDSFSVDTSARHNQSGVPRNQSIQNFLSKPHPLKEWAKGIIPERLGHRVISMLQPGLVSRPGLLPETRNRLTEDYREDILLLQDLIQRDLSHWLENT